VWDHSAIEAIVDLSRRYDRAGKRLYLLHLSQNCRGMLEKANVVVNQIHVDDPGYRVTVAEIGGSDDQS
jgi:SulP family sulfate permease